MKKLLLVLLAIITVGEIFYGCKKGVEDPLLSMRSRKHRMVGKWQVCAYQINGADSLIDNVSDSSISNISVVPSCIGTMTTTRKKTWLMEFDANGLYIFNSKWAWTRKRDWDVNTIDCTDSGVSVPYAWYDSVVLQKGLWTFGGGVGDYNNKELLELTDGVDQVTGTSYEIIELREKEIKLRQSVTDPLTNAVTLWEWTLCPWADSLNTNGNQ